MPAGSPPRISSGMLRRGGESAAGAGSAGAETIGRENAALSAALIAAAVGAWPATSTPASSLGLHIQHSIFSAELQIDTTSLRVI